MDQKTVEVGRMSRVLRTFAGILKAERGGGTTMHLQQVDRQRPKGWW